MYEGLINFLYIKYPDKYKSLIQFEFCEEKRD